MRFLPTCLTLLKLTFHGTFCARKRAQSTTVLTDDLQKVVFASLNLDQSIVSFGALYRPDQGPLIHSRETHSLKKELLREKGAF